MSPNCWAAIDEAVHARTSCRYLEWGSGNSTLAVLRAALADGLAGLRVVSIENDFSFANAMCAAIFELLEKARMKAVVSVEPIVFPKPTLLEALREDPLADLYAAGFLKVLWHSRNDNFWIGSIETDHSGWATILERYLLWLRCVAAFHLSRVQRALEQSGPGAGPRAVDRPGTDGDFVFGRRSRPTHVMFDCGELQVSYLFVPKLENRLWREAAILDGSYFEFADYVSVPLEGQFDVILVDGRARTSCLKRVYYQSLLAPGGILFLHDAHRPAYIEGLRLFGQWSFIRGSDHASAGVSNEPASPTSQLGGPLVRSGSSMSETDALYDRELYFYQAHPFDGRGGPNGNP